MTDKLVLAMSHTFNDSNPDVRFHGKKIILFLSPHQDFDQICRKYLNNEDFKKIINFSSRGNTSDTLIKPNSARRYDSSIYMYDSY